MLTTKSFLKRQESGIVMRDVYIQNAQQRCVFEDCKDLVLDDVYVDGKEIK